jgi:hypothetical protein
MYATVKPGGASSCTAMSGGRRRRGTKRRGTKRHGTKRHGTKRHRRRGTKRHRGGMSCTKGGKKTKSKKSLFSRLGL